MGDTNSAQQLLSREWNMGLGWAAYLDYSHKNVDAMRQLYQTIEIDAKLAEEVKAVKREVHILAIGADWCGDCVTNLPPIARLAALNPKLEFRILDRDRHEELMDQFLTNGAKSIPKVIIGPPNFERIETWGARPAPCQAIMTENKGKMPKEQIIPLMKAWYAADNGRTTLAEIWPLIQNVL